MREVSIMFQGLALRHFVSGFIAVLVGFTSSVAIIFQAANAAGATPSQITSWILALGLGMGLTSIGLSLYYRLPLLTAWSTPGAALLATGLVGLPMSEAIGIFMFSSVLIILSGVTGWFERLTDIIPVPIASAMLAGVLFRFGVDVFVSMQTELVMVSLMFATYLLGKRFLPRYAIMLVLAVGLGYAALQGSIRYEALSLTLATPEFVFPSFNWVSLLSVGIPLFVVTMTSQNLPGIAILKAHNYKAPLSSVISWTGIASLILAPFGGFAFNLAAITAAICMGEDADPDPKKRYLAAFAAGVFYVIIGLLGAAVVVFFASIPQELVLAIAGIALLATIGNGLSAALADVAEREPALITFLVTASGIVLGGIGAAFWGLIAGLLARWVYGFRR
ncbi:benzoate/H(+) symporter BenE family transporter [Leucothrix mucor]|uniref:benzoate/H(+) symporter BenE family transporter n=1 Tax=Leucothrix mucor TaxID=45248 RepID=UPI003CCBBFAB